jgi:hypothetical protein
MTPLIAQTSQRSPLPSPSSSRVRPRSALTRDLSPSYHKLIERPETTGTAVNLIGSRFWQRPPNGTVTMADNVTCIVDGTVIGKSTSYLLCGVEGLNDGEHEMVYRIEGKPDIMGVYVDSIQYTPSPSDPKNETAVVLVDACDPALDWGEHTTWSISWHTIPGIGTESFSTRAKSITTNTNGTQVHYSFYGT